MGSYRQHALDGASAVDLVVALYDGIVRFLFEAMRAVDRGDIEGRRAASKRALDIIIHLQARLRMDVGGEPAKSLGDFYVAIFAQILQASQSASNARYSHVIDCVKNVREAWREVARDPGANMGALRFAESGTAAPFDGDGVSPLPQKPVNWTV
jgi:flagellar protein FliS